MYNKMYPICRVFNLLLEYRYVFKIHSYVLTLKFINYCNGFLYTEVNQVKIKLRHICLVKGAISVEPITWKLAVTQNFYFTITVSHWEQRASLNNQDQITFRLNLPCLHKPITKHIVNNQSLQEKYQPKHRLDLKITEAIIIRDPRLQIVLLDCCK